MEEKIDLVGGFKELYYTRENLIASRDNATELVQPVFDEAINNASVKLAETAESDEVQQFLSNVGRSAVLAYLELQSISESGLVEPEVIAKKQTEINEEFKKPGPKMALEFLNVSVEPVIAPKTPRLATEKQIDFAKRLGLEISSETPRYVASKLIETKIRTEGRKFLKDNSIGNYSTVYHSKHGESEVTKVHEKSGKPTGKVTIQPGQGGRKVVVSAAFLKADTPNE